MLATLLTTALALASTPPVDAADATIDKAIAAMGGIDNLRHLQSLVFRGYHFEGSYKQEYSGSMTGSAHLARMAPNSRLVGCRPEIPGCEGKWGRIVETYDGHHGWELHWPKQRLVHTVGKAEQALRCGAEFLPLFVDYRQRGFSATYLGEQDLLGEHLVAVRIDESGCSSATYYFDPASYRLRMSRLTIPIHARGALKEAVSVHKAFKTVAGVEWPSLSEEVDLATGAVLGGGEWTSIEANTLNDPAVFQAPPVHPVGITAVVLDMLAIAAQGRPTNDVLAAYDRFRSSTQGRKTDVFYDLNWLGFELLKADDYPNAIAVLQRLVEENPVAASAYDSLGDAYAQKGERALAIAAYERALALDASRAQTREKRRQLDP